MPATRDAPLVVASPHSGSLYPDDLLDAAQLDPDTLRRSEDCFVDQLFGDANDCGIPLIRALFPRAYVDVNREPWELDPAMFEDELPAWVNCKSARVASGLGTIARVVSEGVPIYRRKLRFAEAESRVEQFYKPYHEALRGLLDETLNRFEICLLIDAHSMPSTTWRGPGTVGRSELADFVLGDLNGTACDPSVIDAAERLLRRMGYRVARNKPYAGGHTTLIHGVPSAHRHCLQIEVNRALYMNERTLQPRSSFEEVRGNMKTLLSGLVPVISEIKSKNMI